MLEPMAHYLARRSLVEIPSVSCLRPHCCVTAPRDFFGKNLNQIFQEGLITIFKLLCSLLKQYSLGSYISHAWKFVI